MLEPTNDTATNNDETKAPDIKVEEVLISPKQPDLVVKEEEASIQKPNSSVIHKAIHPKQEENKSSFLDTPPPNPILTLAPEKAKEIVPKQEVDKSK